MTDQDGERLRERSFQAENIHCEGCEQAIRAAVGDLDGVASVHADHRNNQVDVAFDDARIDETAIRGRLAESGFPVERTIDNGDIGTWWTTRYGVLTLAVVVAALAGYVGYELYPRFDLPAVSGAGLLVLAAGAGIASFFAPCSFPLLVTLLARRPGEGRRPIVFGAALSVGAAAFLLLAGVLIAAGGRALFAEVTFTSTAGRTLRIVVGSLLVVLGLVQVGVFAASSFHVVERATKSLNHSQARLRRRHPIAGYTAFGFFYLLAGFG